MNISTQDELNLAVDALNANCVTLTDLSVGIPYLTSDVIKPLFDALKKIPLHR